MSSQLALKGGHPLRTTPYPQWPVFDQEEERNLLEVLRSGVWSFTGPKELQFAKSFAEFCGAKGAQCVANGTVSLEIALRALGIGPGDEVIVPSLTWMATALAVLNVGASPIFVDVGRDDWCLDPTAVKQRLTSRTRAIIPVHLYSQMASMDAILEIARQYSLKVMEDCAHAHGSQWKGQAAGTIGHVGSYSFQQSKSMTSGEGGILITQDEALAERIYGFKNCGRPYKQGATAVLGGNYRITEFQAAILLAQLARLPQQIQRRVENIEYFQAKMKGVEGIHFLRGKPEVTRRGMYGLSLRYDAAQLRGVPRDIFIQAMKAEGVPIGPTYELVQKSAVWVSGAQSWKFEKGVDPRVKLDLDASTPVAEAIAIQEGLVLPHHLFLGDKKDVDDLVATFIKVQAAASELTFDTWKHGARQILRKMGI